MFSTRRLILTLIVMAMSPATLHAATVSYWNVFNIEGESAVSSDIVTYASLMDMVADTNRTGTFTVGGVAGENIVGSGSDGQSYWNVFNIEGESAVSSDIVTYASLMDMVADTNRTGTFTVGGVAGENIVGSGAAPMPPAIPLPASAPLLLAAVTAMGLVRRRCAAWVRT